MYYDQISLEFSKQRERELKRKSKVKAQPIFDSKPIVEIYNKIEDVVGPGVDDEKKKDIAVVRKMNRRKDKLRKINKNCHNSCSHNSCNSCNNKYNNSCNNNWIFLKSNHY